MPIYDYECEVCGNISEQIAKIDEIDLDCVCGGHSRRIISATGCFTGNNDATWLKSVTDVIDRETTNPAAREFLNNPTRKNYKDWMKSEGIRPLENNEKRKPDPVDRSKIKKEVWEKFQRRRRIEI